MANGSGLQLFLEQKLPNDSQPNLALIVEALSRAAATYERYAESRSRWMNYNERRRRVREIERQAKQLLTQLNELDLISKDQLAVRLGAEELEKLQGQLTGMMLNCPKVMNAMQATGRPKDVAAWNWVLEVADIYESHFRRKATVSGSGAGDRSSRGEFYKLLQLSLPDSFPRFGSLHPKQLTGILQSRRNRKFRGGLKLAVQAQQRSSS